jgi:hypothetical protein
LSRPSRGAVSESPRGHTALFDLARVRAGLSSVRPGRTIPSRPGALLGNKTGAGTRLLSDGVPAPTETKGNLAYEIDV